MRARETKKIQKEKILSKKYSDFELEEFVGEINDYKSLLSSIGININKENGLTKQNIKISKTKKKNIKESKVKKSNS